jgi:hypothetical protein
MFLDKLQSGVGWLDTRPLAKWGLVALVLLASLGASAWSGYEWLMSPQPGKPDFTLDSTFDELIAATRGADASWYLEAAQCYSRHQGIVTRGATPESPPFEPFCFWGPGTPWTLGQWFRHTGGTTVWTCYWFNVIALFLFGVIALATAALYTRQTVALVLTALLAGFCPLFNSHFFSQNLTSSEIVTLVPLALMTYALCKGFLLRASNSGRLTTLVWFGLAGGWLGMASLSRDSLAQFGMFVALFLIAQTVWRNWWQVGWAVAYAAVLLVCVKIPRYKVEQWNLNRIGYPVVSTSQNLSVWRTGLWAKHDFAPWCELSGLGFGEYLDPEGPARVEAYYESKEPYPELYSLGQLVQAIGKHPLKALEFKVARLPVLWLGTFEWPRCVVYLVSVWCTGTYVILFAYLFVRFRARRPIPEPLYLFPLFLACAMPLIHFEVRYSFPAWHMLVILPALWAAHRAELATAILPQGESPGGTGCQSVQQRLAA